MVSQIECTVNVVEENERKLATVATTTNGNNKKSQA